MKKKIFSNDQLYTRFSEYSPLLDKNSPDTLKADLAYAIHKTLSAYKTYFGSIETVNGRSRLKLIEKLSKDGKLSSDYRLIHINDDVLSLFNKKGYVFDPDGSHFNLSNSALILALNDKRIDIIYIEGFPHDQTSSFLVVTRMMLSKMRSAEKANELKNSESGIILQSLMKWAQIQPNPEIPFVSFGERKYSLNELIEEVHKNSEFGKRLLESFTLLAIRIGLNNSTNPE